MEYLKQRFLLLQLLRKEHLGIIIVLLIFCLFPDIIRLLDNTAAPIDPGAISAILMAVLAVLIFKLTTWWLIKIIWPALASYARYHFETNFKSLTSWQKTITFLGFYCLLLSAFIFTLAAIL